MLDATRGELSHERNSGQSASGARLPWDQLDRYSTPSGRLTTVVGIYNNLLGKPTETYNDKYVTRKAIRQTQSMFSDHNRANLEAAATEVLTAGINDPQESPAMTVAQDLLNRVTTEGVREAHMSSDDAREIRTAFVATVFQDKFIEHIGEYPTNGHSLPGLQHDV